MKLWKLIEILKRLDEDSSVDVLLVTPEGKLHIDHVSSAETTGDAPVPLHIEIHARGVR